MITPIEKTIEEFTKLREMAGSLRDLIYLDGVLSVLDSMKTYEVQYYENLKKELENH